MTIYATPNNMVRYPGHVALSLFTGEEYSATAGDYWNHPADQPLTDENGPLVLARKVCKWIDPEGNEL